MTKKALVLVACLAVVSAALSAVAQAVPESVRILRDSYGVPHIFSNDDLKGAFASGYTMAEDRLFQMEILRRAGKGRLAELIGDGSALGATAAEFDIAIRRELYTEPERADMFAELESTDPASAAQFRAFVDGVNLRITQDLADPIRKLPSEYLALGTLPEPWSVTDSIAFAAVGLSIFGAEGGHEVENACLLSGLTARHGEPQAEGIFDDLYWIDDPDAPATITEGEAVWPNSISRFNAGQMALLHDPSIKSAICKAADAQHAEEAAIDTVGNRLGIGGLFAPGHSNALVVSGSHTSTGHPMLGGGPQVGYSTPSFFWESGLHTPNYDSAGVNVPLGPGNIMGRTSTLSYTVTSGIDDQIDTYVERLNPDNLRQYGTPGNWRDMDCRTETFLVRMNPTSPPDSPGISTEDPARSKPPVRPVVQDLCRTIHGPVFFIDRENLVAFSHRKAHWLQDLKGAVTWLSLGRKTKLTGPDSVEEALDGFPFTFNFNYASTSGDIAYFHRGLTPLRPNNTDPRLPLPGVGYEWRTGLDGKNYIANSAILTTDGKKAATIVNPTQGYFANWNNKPIKGWAGIGELREMWGPRHRMEGISREVDRLIAAGTKVTLNESDTDPTTSAACFANDDYEVGTDPLGCVTSINGIIRKAATSDVHVSTVLPFLAKALEVEGTAPDSPEYRAFLNMKQWSDGGAPLLRNGSDESYRAPGIAIYRAWRQRLQETLLDDVNPYNRNMDFPPFIDGSNEDDHGSYQTPDSVLYHILTHAPELDGAEPATTFAPSRDYCAPVSCAELLVSTLAQTVSALTSRFGLSDQSAWREPVIVSTMSAQGAAPNVTVERMNRGSFNQLHDFGVGSAFRTYNVVPPGQSGMIDLATLVASQAGDDKEAAVNDGNPHVFDQKALYEGWRFKPLIQYEGALVGAREEIVPYVRGVVPQPDTALLQHLWRMLEQAGITLPNFDLFGEVATE
ncbi:MAG: penicillin acylase family protein [Actinomycetota bacterium]|nr:penicillin acylase family protein [Actinomycetota bacterium]